MYILHVVRARLQLVSRPDAYPDAPLNGASARRQKENGPRHRVAMPEQELIDERTLELGKRVRF